MYLCSINNMNEFWKSEMDAGYYDKIFKSGEISQRGIQSNWHRSTFLKVLSLVKSSRLHLDYACGPGTFIGNFIKCKSIGTDISDVQIDYANELYGQKANFIKLKDFNFDLYTGKFDSITVLGLLEFCDDKTNIELIDTLYNLLNKDGKLILTTPNYGILMYFLEIILNKFGNINYKNQNVNKYNKYKLKELVKKSKFQNLNVMRHLNFGIFMSFFSYKKADKFMNLIDKIFKNFFGSLLIVELRK